MNLATSTNRRLYNSRRNVPTSLPLVETRQQHKSQIWFDLLKCRGRPDFTTVVCCKNCWDLEWPWPGVSGQLTGTSSRVTLYKLSLSLCLASFFPSSSHRDQLVLWRSSSHFAQLCAESTGTAEGAKQGPPSIHNGPLATHHSPRALLFYNPKRRGRKEKRKKI